MAHRFDPESVDLAKVAAFLRTSSGHFVEGAVLGRSSMRDDVALYLDCSQLEAETIVDTMIARGFLVLRREPNGLVRWLIKAF